MKHVYFSRRDCGSVSLHYYDKDDHAAVAGHLNILISGYNSASYTFTPEEVLALKEWLKGEIKE